MGILRALWPILLIVWSMAASAQGDHDNDSLQRVLFIASYHPGFPTFFQQVEGLQSVLKSPAVKLDIEFMDAKRFDERQLENVFFANLSRKLAQLPPYDLVITADDAATHFAIRHRDDVFANLPIVFFGVNDLDFAAHFNTDPRVTGVAEKAAMLDTVTLIRHLFGDHEIVVVTDSSATARVDTERFDAIMQQADVSHYREISLADNSFEELEHQVAQLHPPTSLLLISIFRDRTGAVQDFERTLMEIRAVAKVPIFHLWYHGMGDGVLGGRLLSHKTQAQLAARMALRILAGDSPAAIPVVLDSPTEYVFDYREMQRFGLSPDDMPAGSRYINAPDPLSQRYHKYIIASEVVLVLLAIAIVMLLFRMRARRAYEKQLVRINDELESKVGQRTAALERAHREAERLLRLRDSILDNSLVSIVLTKSRRIEWVNGYAETMFGYHSDEVIGRDSEFIYVHPDDFEKVTQDAPAFWQRGEAYQAEYAFRRKDGSVLWGIVSGSALNPADLGEGVLFIVIDISARKRAEERLKLLNARLETQATTDHLTGISNRRHMAELINKEINRVNRYYNVFSIILLDVDFFKKLNDTHGHLAGDDVLKNIAAILRQTCRQVDTPSRWGGEEFLVLCPATLLKDAEKLAHLLRARMEQFDFGLPCRVTASFGVAVHHHGQSLEALVRDADQALYAAKESRNCVRSAQLTPANHP